MDIVTEQLALTFSLSTDNRTHPVKKFRHVLITHCHGKEGDGSNQLYHTQPGFEGRMTL